MGKENLTGSTDTAIFHRWRNVNPVIRVATSLLIIASPFLDACTGNRSKPPIIACGIVRTVGEGGAADTILKCQGRDFDLSVDQSRERLSGALFIGSYQVSGGINK